MSTLFDLDKHIADASILLFKDQYGDRYARLIAEREENPEVGVLPRTNRLPLLKIDSVTHD